jgi:hypothetical protein
VNKHPNPSVFQTKDMIKTLHTLWLEYDKVCKLWLMVGVDVVGDAFLGVCGAPGRFEQHASYAAGFSLGMYLSFVAIQLNVVTERL